MYKSYEEIVDAKLVSYTKPAGCFDHLTGEENETISNLISYCARVSNPKNQENLTTSKKLISYLLKHKHFSPFEMVSACMEITTTRDIARQILRHRSFSFQEYSQRYADPTEDLEFCLREARLQDNKNRQNSFESYDEVLSDLWEKSQTDLINKSKSNYMFAITNGIAKEVARVILPEGNTVSRIYMNGTIRSWIHYLDVRLGNGTQKEHSMVASLCANQLLKIFPVINN